MGGAIQRRFDGHSRRFRRLGSKMRWIFLSGITQGEMPSSRGLEFLCTYLLLLRCRLKGDVDAMLGGNSS